MPLAALPAFGAQLESGTFAGILTQPDGTHAAIVLLPDQGSNLTWKAAQAWAKNLGAQLPTRPIAALLFANVKGELRPQWHWTSESFDASSAWYCHFDSGTQLNYRKSFQGSAVAVRLIHLSA